MAVFHVEVEYAEQYVVRDDGHAVMAVGKHVAVSCLVMLMDTRLEGNLASCCCSTTDAVPESHVLAGVDVAVRQATLGFHHQ